MMMRFRFELAHTEGYPLFISRFRETESRSSALLICRLFTLGYNSSLPDQQAGSRLSSLSFSCWPGCGHTRRCHTPVAMVTRVRTPDAGGGYTP